MVLKQTLGTGLLATQSGDPGFDGCAEGQQDSDYDDDGGNGTGDDGKEVVVVDDQSLTQIGLRNGTEYKGQNHGGGRNVDFFKEITQNTKEEGNPYRKHGVFQRVGAHEDKGKDQGIEGSGFYIEDAYKQGQGTQADADQNDIA